MEPLGANAEGEWGSLSGMYTNEEADFMAQLLGNCQFPNDLDGSTNFRNASLLWPGNYESSMNLSGFSEGSYYSLDVGDNNTSSYSHSDGSSILFPSSSSQESYYLSDSQPIFVTQNSSFGCMDFCLGDANHTTSYLIEGDECLKQEMSHGNKENRSKNESEMQLIEPVPEEKTINNPSENSKKRSRSTTDAQKNKKVSRPRKNQKTVPPTNNEQEDNNNGALNRQTSSSCCSDDDSNASQELYGGETSSLSSKGKAAVNLNGKTRASRASATDPQSLYSRKRRARVNERLRILQNLVPNGTKFDISTMLEEAVQYVKFLQLQIKLLSSDDLRMYAPIAYNGMKIGLDLKVTAPR
ncbi:transcription factor bHLH84-like [Mangifera indica]|uniref:transcription factor bHLH84-like n=1 Tax=Mangifera indica TaxID=29780 RepID=UPI001CFB0DDA|nr:transcription factor bHLH84-like [Mangifera indica]